jgi:hypothetical protein
VVVNISEIPELHYITHVSNLPSIFRHGLLCHRDAAKLKPVSVALPQVQSRRARKQVPGALWLHQYVNLYFNARNPMLYRNCMELSHEVMSVISISTDVMKLNGVVLTDGNAASDRTAFSSFPVGLKKLDRELVYAEYWTDKNPITEERKKWVICAEVLVPAHIDPQYLQRIYVVNKTIGTTIEAPVPVSENAYLFFRTKTS